MVSYLSQQFSQELSSTASPTFKEFLNPKKVDASNFKDEDNWVAYLRNVKQHVLAEYWAFMSNASSNYPGWREKSLVRLKMRSAIGPSLLSGGDTAASEMMLLEDKDERYYVSDPRNGDDTSSFDRKHGKESDDDGESQLMKADNEGEFTKHLVIWKNRLNLLKFNKNDGTYSLSSGSELISKEFDDARDVGVGQFAYSYGYIGDRLNDFTSVLTLLLHECNGTPPPSLICSVARPSKRLLVPYPKVMEPEKKLPINKGQEDALLGLKYDIEYIQGPPG
jgi:hypothetical protein